MEKHVPSSPGFQRKNEGCMGFGRRKGRAPGHPGKLEMSKGLAQSEVWHEILPFLPSVPMCHIP